MNIAARSPTRSRRQLLGDGLLLGALGLGRSQPVHSQPGAGALPARGEFVVRGAFVMTMDAAGDLPDTDIHIRGGEIVALGPRLDASDAETIDGDGMIVLPGLVETHWHMWTTMLRSMSGDRDEHGYFPTSRGIGAFYTQRDMYRSTRLAAAEAIHSGITFVHDWCHNVRSPAFAAADLRALAESGIRARFSYGTPTGAAGDMPIDRDDLSQLARNWDEHSNDGLLSLGLAWRGVATDASRGDYTAARELGLPVSVHVNNFPQSAGGIAAIAREGMLGPDVQLIHAIWANPAEIAAIARSGASVSLSPYTELRIGFGFPLTGELLDAGIEVGLSVDTPALSGNADMFAIMKAIQNIENGRAQNEFRLPARRVLEMATIGGARSMGIESLVGSISPGKRADLIMVNTRHLNLGVFTEPAHMIVEAAQPANVDTVMIDGRVLKRAGQLTAIDATQVVTAAQEAQVAVRDRAGWW